MSPSDPWRRLPMWKRVLLVAACAVLLCSATAPALDSPTFSHEVVRIFQARCQTCHRPGEHAPFSLLTYRDAYERRDDIRDAVKGRAMRSEERRVGNEGKSQ